MNSPCITELSEVLFHHFQREAIINRKNSKIQRRNKNCKDIKISGESKLRLRVVPQISFARSKALLPCLIKLHYLSQYYCLIISNDYWSETFLKNSEEERESNLEETKISRKSKLQLRVIFHITFASKVIQGYIEAESRYSSVRWTAAVDVSRNLIPRAVHKQTQQKRLCTTKCLFFADARATPSTAPAAGEEGHAVSWIRAWKRSCCSQHACQPFFCALCI